MLLLHIFTLLNKKECLEISTINIEFRLTDESYAQINVNPKGRFILKNSAKYEHPNSTPIQSVTFYTNLKLCYIKIIIIKSHFLNIV